MAPEEIELILKSSNAPAREFWEKELEIPVEPILRLATDEQHMEQWVGKRNGRQLDILRQALGLKPVKTIRDKKEQLKKTNGALVPHRLVQEFSTRKSKLAIVDLARTVLPSEIVDACRIKDEDFDTLALCFAIYSLEPMQLRCILHLDKLHKRGAARMVMTGNHRRPDQPLAEFMTNKNISGVLLEYDDSKGDGRIGELMNIMPHDNHMLVFVRRCFRQSFILRGHDVFHGHEPEWIVFDFFDGAKRVNISSTSATESLEIANMIASQYYEDECEYENESEITYAMQITRLLEQLREDQLDEFVWVEISTNGSPLTGDKPIMIGELHNDSIGEAVRGLETKMGPLINVVDRIESIKVLYRKKRVKLIFEKLEHGEEQYVVRYTDHTLNPLERSAFEGYMRLNHAIPALSTEKRFKRNA